MVIFFSYVQGDGAVAYAAYRSEGNSVRMRLNQSVKGSMHRPTDARV